MKKLLALVSSLSSVFVLGMSSVLIPAVILVFVLVAGTPPPQFTGGNIVGLLTITLAATALPSLALSETIILLIILAL